MPRNYRTKHTIARYDVVGCDPYNMYERWDMGVEPVCSAEEDAYDAFDETYLQWACQTRIYEKCKRKGHIPSFVEITEFVEAASKVAFPATGAKYITNWWYFTVAMNSLGHLAPMQHVKCNYNYGDDDDDEDDGDIDVLCSSCFDTDEYACSGKRSYDAYCHHPSCRVRAGWKEHTINIGCEYIRFKTVGNLLDYIRQIMYNKKTSKALLASATKLHHKITCCIANGLPSGFIPLTIYNKQQTVQEYCEQYNAELSLKQAMRIELDEYLKHRGEAMYDYWMATCGTPCNPVLLH